MANGNVRKTGKDYRNEHKELTGKLNSLKAKVSARLLELCKQYPDVVLPDNCAGILKSKDIANKLIIDDIKVEYLILYIETIETELANRHPHKQTQIQGF